MCPDQKKEWVVMVVGGGGGSRLAGDCSTALCTAMHAHTLALLIQNKVHNAAH